MKKSMVILCSIVLFFGYNTLLPKLNKFGISDIIPSHADDNAAFDKRIKEEMTKNKNLKFEGRHTTSFTIQDILKFIDTIKAYFEYLLNTNNQNPDAFELAKLAIVDVEKAKKMLKPQDVTAYEEHLLRDAFGPIKTKINAYKHTDKIEESSYVRP